MAEPVDVAVLGERLKRARKAREVTLREVAEQAAISIATVSRIERGDTKSVDSATLLALARWIGADAQEFLQRPEVGCSPAAKEQGTPEIVELHLRADKNLDRQTAMMLAKMFRAAYDSLAKEQRQKKRG